jgi:S1-C subfamily serine protease
MHRLHGTHSTATEHRLALRATTPASSRRRYSISRWLTVVLASLLLVGLGAYLRWSAVRETADDPADSLAVSGETVRSVSAISAAPPSAAKSEDNPYIDKVDEAVEDPHVRMAIRRVQPACVRIAGSSGVNLTPDGRILTAGHVARDFQGPLVVTFPDGRAFAADWTAVDFRWDLALCRVSGGQDLPFAALAEEPPLPGIVVVCIGQPGTMSPEGDATGHEPFSVSMGEIRDIDDDPLGHQLLGRTQHDAWTYWGHSGAPLFNDEGRIVAMHNSWDPRNSMRHAVSYQAIREFLRRQGIGK